MDSDVVAHPQTGELAGVDGMSDTTFGGAMRERVRAVAVEIQASLEAQQAWSVARSISMRE